MTGLISSLIAEFWPYIAGAIALAATWFSARSSGKKSERTKQTREKLETTERIDDAIHGDSSNLGWRDRLQQRDK